MPTAGHPSAAALAAFALGKLEPPAAAETVNDHLIACADCRTVVETTPNDSLAALLRLSPDESPSQAGGAGPGTRQVSNPSFDKSELPAELHDHPRYRIVRKLGQGGMGAVYQAEHKLMGRTVAVKVIAPALVDSPDAVERFQREVKAAARLEHVNIVRAYDADTAGSAMLLAMEFVKGRTLAELVAAKGPLPVGFACQCVRQAALGLQHAADHGMVHRDIKPQNLMLTDERVVKILDFGLAKLASEQTSQAGLTAKNIVMGTPEYMAPEQARNTAAADIRADIYALGCTLFYLLTGRPPFRGESAIEVLTRHATDAPPRLTEVRPEVPAALADLVERLLAKDPAGRPQTPQDVADALRAFARATGDSAVRDSATGETPVAHRRWLVPTAIAAGLALAAMALSAGGVFRVKTPDGTIVLTVNEPGAEVLVDGARVTVTRGSGERMEITAAPGGRLEVRKPGFRAVTRDLTLDPGGPRELAVRLEPDAPPAAVGATTPPAVPAPEKRYALSFDGRAARARIRKADFPFTGRHSLTVEAVVIPRACTGTHSVIGNLSGATGLGLTLTPDRHWSFKFGVGGNSATVVNSTVVRDGTRYHLAAVYEHGPGVLRLFVNGKLGGAEKTAGREYRPGPWDLIIGADPYNPGTRFTNFFDGTIEQFRVSGVARYRVDHDPPADLTADAGTTVLYRFTEGDGSVLNDSSGRGAHAWVERAKWVRRAP